MAPLLFACGKRSEPPKPWLELGTGASEFTPLRDGDAVDIVRGPQGGFHIWGALRASPELDPQAIAVKYFVYSATGAEISVNAYRINLTQREDHSEWHGLLGIVPEPAVVTGTEVLLRIEVVDSALQTAADERRVTAQGP